MKHIAIAVLLSSVIAGNAMARSSFDPQNGNAYRSATAVDDSTTVQGYSFASGSAWETVIEADGDMRGVDSAGNAWQYDRQTGSYWNADGRRCVGKGAARVCN